MQILLKKCKNKDIFKPSNDTKILGFNQYLKSHQALFLIYADLEWLVGKIDRCKNNPENSSTTRVGKHFP